jgi:hypothetical protein
LVRKTANRRAMVQPGFQRIVGLGQFQMCPSAAEQLGEQLLEMGVDLFEGGNKPGAAFTVKLVDSLAQAGDGLDQVLALGLHGSDLLAELLGLLMGPQIDRPHVVPLPHKPFKTAFGGLFFGRVLGVDGTDLGERVGCAL